MKAVLISIQPKWCELIANVKKTVEVRKTKPKIETPFKVYIYCTNNKRQWLRKLGTSFREIFITENRDVLGRTEKVKSLIGDATFWENGGYNGKVIGEFVCDKVVEFENSMYESSFVETSVLSCVVLEELALYLGKNDFGYGWHISNLKIYDKPKELSEFATICEGLKPYQCEKCEYSYTESNESIGVYHECCCNNLKPLKRPPQSWCYVEELKEGADND